MIVKPSISFLTNDSDPLLITDINSILTSTDGNVHYPAPTPELPAIQAALDGFSLALAEAADGGLTLTSIKNDKRAALVDMMRDLASYVQVACQGDLTILLTSGFPIQKPQRNPIGVLPAPVNLKLSLGSRTGELDAVMPPVFGAAIYNWQLMRADAPTVVLQTAQTTAAASSFTGLTPGVIYSAQVNAMGAAGPSNWSDPVSQMVV